MNDKLQEAFYIKDLISQRDQLIYVCSKDNLDSLWNDCGDNLPDITTNDNYNPTYLQLLIGLDNLLKNEDCIEEDIFKVKDYIIFSIDQRLEETVSLLKKRIEIMNKNIKSLKKKYKKDWTLSYDEAIINGDLDKKDNNLNIDDILDKINSRGMSSLTKDEKNFLKSSGGKDIDGKDIDNDKKDDKD